MRFRICTLKFTLTLKKINLRRFFGKKSRIFLMPKQIIYFNLDKIWTFKRFYMASAQNFIWANKLKITQTNFFHFCSAESQQKVLPKVWFPFISPPYVHAALRVKSARDWRRSENCEKYLRDGNKKKFFSFKILSFGGRTKIV